MVNYFQVKRILGSTNGLTLILLSLPFLISITGKFIREDRSGFTVLDHLVLVLPESFFYILLWGGFTATIALFSKMRMPFRLSAKALLLLLLVNFIMLEVIGHMYKVATGDNDFDYALIFYSIGNILELWPVFTAEFGNLLLWLLVTLFFGISCFLVWLVHKAFSYSISSKFKQCFSIGFVLLGGLYLASEQHYQFSVKPGRNDPVLDFNPPPVSLAVFTHSLKKTLHNWQQGPVKMLRQGYPTNAVLTPNDSKKLQNIVLIILESTGRDKTISKATLYPKTNFLKKLANEGRDYTNAYTFIPHTSKSITSIICGIEPFLGMQNLAGKLSNGILSKCLPSLLRDIGYSSVYFSPVIGDFEYREKFINNAGFDEYTIYEQIPEKEKYHPLNRFGIEENSLLPSVENYLSKSNNKPFFATFLTLSPHHPYKPVPSEKIVQFNEQDELNNHLTGLQYQDKFLKKLFDTFESFGKLEETIFIFVGDHGEAFGKHGLKQHDTVIFNEVLNVPFVIWGNSIKSEQISTPVSLLDVLPTIVDIIGAEITNAADGYAGKNTKLRKKTDSIFSYCFREQYCASHIIGDWKLIHYFGHKPDLLFNLKLDPEEQTNLRDNESERAASMAKQLKEYFQFVDEYHALHLKGNNSWIVE